MLFLFVRKSSDYLAYAIVTVFATVGSNILNFIHAKKFCDIHLNFKFNWKNTLLPILIIFATNIAVQIYVNSDTTMLGFLKDDYTVGVYSVSTKIYSIVKSVLAAVMIVTIPRLSLYLGKHMNDEYDKLLYKVINVLIVFTLPVMVGLVMLSRNVILILSGQNYIRSTSSLQILCFGIVLSIFSSIFNQCVLIPYKREKFSLYSSVVSAIINIALNFILIPLMAEIGAAITTLVAEFLMMTMNYYSCRDITKKIFINKETKHNIYSVFIGLIIIVIDCFLVKKFFSNIWIQLILSVIVSSISYAVILFIFRNPIAEVVKQKLKVKLGV